MDRDIPILLVEDDLLDQRAVERAFEENKLSNPLYVVTTGEAAMDYLRRAGDYEDPGLAPRPGLILLDLNLPAMSGLEVLQAYRGNPHLATIPSVVLTTSAEQRDLVESYRLGVAGYIQKPVDFHQFVDVVRRFDLYWSLCRLPSASA